MLCYNNFRYIFTFISETHFNMKIINTSILLVLVLNFHSQPTIILTPCLLAANLLTTFVNSLDPDQALHCVGPDLDPNCLTF